MSENLPESFLSNNADEASAGGSENTKHILVKKHLRVY
jgi:hypothetical protein